MKYRKLQSYEVMKHPKGLHTERVQNDAVPENSAELERKLIRSRRSARSYVHVYKTRLHTYRRIQAQRLQYTLEVHTSGQATRRSPVEVHRSLYSPVKLWGS